MSYEKVSILGLQPLLLVRLHPWLNTIELRDQLTIIAWGGGDGRFWGDRMVFRVN